MFINGTKQVYLLFKCYYSEDFKAFVILGRLIY